MLDASLRSLSMELWRTRRLYYDGTPLDLRHYEQSSADICRTSPSTAELGSSALRFKLAVQTELKARAPALHKLDSLCTCLLGVTPFPLGRASAYYRPTTALM